MAKLSVYVPDELLAEAKQADPEVRPSSILQDALRSRLVDRNSRPYAQLDGQLRREREEAQRVVIDRMADAWRTGYSAGLEFAKHLPWEAFEDFATLRWDLPLWRESFDEHEYRLIDPAPDEEGLVLSYFGPLLVHLQAWGPSFPTADDGTPIGVIGEGFADAIRDVWEGARSFRPARPEILGSADAPQPTDVDEPTDADDDHTA